MTFNSNITQRVSSWISVEEFGAVGDGLVNDEFAIQEAINYAITYRLKLYLGSGKNFRITKPMLVPVYTGQNNLYLDGNGSTITMTSADFAFKIIAAQDDVRGIPQFRNMVIAGSSASGFDVGQNFDNMATPKMYGDGRGPMFYNILTSQLGGIALRIQNAAHFDVDKFIARTDNYTGDGLQILAGSGKFTGDITFNDCQFQSQADGHYAAYLNSYSTVGAQYATQLRGIRFNHCVFYGGQTFVACSTNGQTADIWFNNCAWDANNRPIAIVVDVNQNGQMNKIMFSDFYIVGYDRGFIFSKNTTESQVANVKIQSGMIGGVQQPIYFVGMSGFDVQNCTFDGCISPYALINIDQDCQRFKISDNMEANSNGSYMISIIGPNTNKFSCSNNVCYDMGSVIRDMTGSVSKQVNNNSKL